MPLCDDKVRGQMAPMQAGERNFDFYDTSGHAPFAGYRELMNSWILEFPENERVELVSRMKTGTNVQYEQALAEIIIYIALNRLGYKIRREGRTSSLATRRAPPSPMSKSRHLFKNSSRSRPLKLSMTAFWIGLPGAM